MQTPNLLQRLDTDSSLRRLKSAIVRKDTTETHHEYIKRLAEAKGKGDIDRGAPSPRPQTPKKDLK